MAGAKHYGCDTTIMNEFSSYFVNLSSRAQIFFDEPLCAHTSFKTGGNADVLILPQTEAGLIDSMQIIWQNALPYYIIGRGTNLLISDSGLRGVVIKIAYSELNYEGDIITASAGTSLKQLALYAIDHGLCGLEFAAGIPGTLGGGVVMNAGAYGGELGEYIASARVLDNSGKILELTNNELSFGYRSCAIQKSTYTVLSASFCLHQGDRQKSMAKIEELATKRREKQPLEYPSAGSTFKRPTGNFAGALIEQCGLKGTEYGGAQVSQKHAGFIINTGGASSTDIYNLIKNIKTTVQKNTGILLEPEVRILGEFDD